MTLEASRLRREGERDGQTAPSPIGAAGNFEFTLLFREIPRTSILLASSCATCRRRMAEVGAKLNAAEARAKAAEAKVEYLEKQLAAQRADKKPATVPEGGKAPN